MRSSASDTPSQEKIRVLIVDDSQIGLIFIKRVIENLGCEVCYAENGEAALDLMAQNFLNEEASDIILMNLEMPLMDGMKCTKVIRKFEEENLLARCPIVGISSNPETECKENALACGMDEYIENPIYSVKIESILQKYFKDDPRLRRRPLQSLLFKDEVAEKEFAFTPTSSPKASPNS